MMSWGLAVCMTLWGAAVHGQLLSWTPDFIRETGTSNIEVTADATRGNRGLENYSTPSDVYVHIGVITTLSNSPTDWKYVKFSSFTTPNAPAQCVSLGSNKWKFAITGGLRAFFGITNASERILRIAILFRSGNGSVVLRNADGSDMYVPVYDDGLAVRIDQPFRQPMYIPKPETLSLKAGDNFTVSVKGSPASTLKLFYNGTQLGSTAGNATSITSNTSVPSTGAQVIVAEASDGTLTVRDTISFFVASPTPEGPVPAGLRNGINYEPGDTSATLVFFAPGKTDVMVLGDFNNWTESARYQMTRSTDGRFWLRITGLTPGTEYAYQFLVDGSLRVADYYTEKVLDPWNDPNITSSRYPGLKAYPTGKATGIVSVLQTAKPRYNWKVQNFNRPDKRNLIVYELLLRDFLAQSDWKTLTDTLPYLKRLGVNVVQLMPVNEFEGNSSWGYNPSFYFAPDKFYGPENDLRRFIDSCHSRGMAVVLDMTLNHSFGSSPMVQLYFDQAAGKPLPTNPWFNPDARHPFNVGYDFNHESAATRDFVDRVIEHWLASYKVDGFRWDLSKGFTQVNNPTNVGAWGAYDASRIAIWKRIYDKMQAVLPGSYCILEHFAANSEEIELADYGMLLWGNMNFNFNEATMGFLPQSGFEGGLASVRGWTKPHLVTYMESHDEERLMYKNLTFGSNANSGHDVRTLPVALERSAMAAAFWAMMPGPKMIWQFGELGYDYSITWCPSSSSVPTPYPNMQCRTDPKPPRWDYRQDASRAKLFNVYSALLALRNDPRFTGTFTANANTTQAIGSRAVKILKVVGDSLSVVVIGNFGTSFVADTVSFPRAGTWYDHLNRTTFTATGGPQTFALVPGQYFVYVDRNLSNNLVTSVRDLRAEAGDRTFVVYPNPVGAFATVDYVLSSSAAVEIALWDLSGRRMGTLFRGIRTAGRHSITFTPGAVAGGPLPAGRYFVTLQAGIRRMRRDILIANEP